MAGLRLQNRYAFLDEPSPSNAEVASRPSRDQEPAFDWNKPRGTVEQANADLKQFYHRQHRIDTPLGFDDAGKVWQWHDHHASSTCKAAPQYSCHLSKGGLQVGQVDLAKLLHKLSLYTDKWIPKTTVWLYVDNRSLINDEQPSYWASFSPWIQERCRWVGPYQEYTVAEYIPSTEEFGLNEVHYTWAGTYVLEAAAFLYPDVNFILVDADCVPTSLFEVEELIHLAQHLYPQTPRHHINGAVLLVSEPHSELNAGFVCIGRRAGERMTKQQDWVAAATLLVESRERFLLTSDLPKDPTEAAMSGLLLTPLLGCTAEHSLDWCHAWALLGVWANFVVFPLPTKTRDNGRTLQWPRHGHTGKLRPEMQKRTPSLVGWARPAFEQGALPPLSILPANCPVCVLPGDKLFQSDMLHEQFMNPVIFHGFSGNKDKWGKELEKAGKKGMLPLAACLLGTDDYPPLWQHQGGSSFVVGSKWTARQKRGRLTAGQLDVILQAWWRSPLLPVAPMFRNNPYQITVLKRQDDQKIIPPHVPKKVFTEAGTDGIPEEKQEIQLQIRAAKARADYLSDTQDWARQEQQDQDMLGLSVWCTGLGGGDPPEQGFLHVLSCVPHSPVYSATLARKDDWDKQRTTLGRTAAVHEYFVFQALSTTHGAQTWESVPGAACCDAGLLAHRTAWVLANAKLIPAHRREPHTSWMAAVRLFLLLLHPQPLALLWAWTQRGKYTRQDILPLKIQGFSAGSLSGLVLHNIALEFGATFVGHTRLGAIACSPTQLTKHTPKCRRSLHLVHYEGDQLCVWYASQEVRDSLVERNIHFTWITHSEEDKNEIDWLGGMQHNYYHLPCLSLPTGCYTWNQLERTVSGVSPTEVSHAGPRRLLAWVLIDIPEDQREFVNALSQAYGSLGGQPLQIASSYGLDTDKDLQMHLLNSIQVRMGTTTCSEDVANALKLVLANTPSHLLVYLLDYFLQQLQSSYWAERTPYALSVKAYQLSRNQDPLQISAKMLRLGCGGMHQYLMTTEDHHVFGFADPQHKTTTVVDLAGIQGRNPPLLALKVDDVLAFSSWDDANLSYQTCVGIVTRKQDRTRNKKKNETPLERRLRHTSPKSITVVLLPGQVVTSFFPFLEAELGRQLAVDEWRYAVHLANPPMRETFTLTVDCINLIGKTMSAHEILSTISAPPERLPGGLGILSISTALEPPNEVLRTRLIDTLTRTLERMLSPISLQPDTEIGDWFLQTGLVLAEDADGHILGAITAMLMAAYMGRLDLSIAGLFGAGKSRAAAVLLVGMLIVNPDVKVLVICKENSAARSFVQLLLSTSPPASVLSRLGRLVSDDEYSANRTELDVPPTNRNESLKTKRALVATGGLLANELKSRWTGIRTWSEDLTVAFMEEAQQYGGANEVVVVTKLLHQALLIFGGDKCQTPGGLNRHATGSDTARQKLLQRSHGLRIPSKQLQPASLELKLKAMIVRSTAPVAQSLGTLLTLAEGHDSLFTAESGQVLSKLRGDFPHLKFLHGKDGKYLNLESSLVRTAAILLIAGQDESFFSAVQARTNLESAGASGEVHSWHLMLPTSARVSPLTYAAVVATRYMELCRRQANGWMLGTFARGGIPGLPGGFHTVLWYPNRRASADYDLVVNVLFDCLYHQHTWDTTAKESLYVMCNASDDVYTLKRNKLFTESHGKVRVDTVASSASTTAKVAAVIQRGGSFLAGSFTDMAWAEDCAGRATVCLTRSMSYTSLISPLEMRGLFGMAQVIGAKTLGVVLVTEKYSRWTAPQHHLEDKQYMDQLSINSAPHWTDIPLAMVYQTKALDDSSESRKRKSSHQAATQVAHRLRLVMIRLRDCPSYVSKFQESILTAVSGHHFAVPHQKMEDLPSELYRYAVLWGYAFDKQQRPAFIILPTQASFSLLRTEDGRLFEVGIHHNPPMRPLPGIYFFDAWRLHPQMTDLAPAAMPSSEPLPNLQADGEDPGTKTSRRKAIARERNHQQILLSQDEEDYEILASAQTDLADLDAEWRSQIRDRPSLFLAEIAEIDTIALALHTATINWPWTRLIIHIDSIAPRFESLFKLACLEFHLREVTLNGPDLDQTRYRVYCLFLQFLSRLVVGFLQPAEGTLRQIFPELLFMLEEQYWFRALMEESLAVMSVDSNVSRDSRGPWGLLKLQQPSTNSLQKSVNIILDRLFVWLPVQCGIDLMRHFAAQGATKTKYRLPKSREGDTDGEKFSFYGIQGKVETVAFEDLRPEFPSSGHLFKAGCLNVSVAQAFSRGVTVDYVIELPLFNPAILERSGNFISRDLLPSKWVLNSTSACLIAEELKEWDDDTFIQENKKFFLHRQTSPLMLRDGTNGLNEVYKTPVKYFHPEPQRFWDNLPLKFDLHKVQRAGFIQPRVQDQAKRLARREVKEPEPQIPPYLF